VFFDNFVGLCNANKISPSAAAEAMGFQRSVVTRWKNGAAVRTATVRKVADYFGVTVDDLLKDEKTPTPTNGDGLTIDKICANLSSLSRGDIEALMVEVALELKKRGEE
jgi:transcriptional regulator with XRE-family HTH domain